MFSIKRTAGVLVGLAGVVMAAVATPAVGQVQAPGVTSASPAGAPVASAASSDCNGLADDLTCYMYGVTGTYLGLGAWLSEPAGANGNGEIYADDALCDGANGIITALYRSNGSLVNLVSDRDCGEGQRVNAVKAPSAGGPAEGEEVRIKACKLLPDGTWRDCVEAWGVNDY
ncbi:hypothetical protein [Streptomyces sp. KR55]|uniref:hypothetical protein n=1 Tax=Streptomyces sp. KR55 TaxID=3457425 RepID=UPI003FD3E03C